MGVQGGSETSVSHTQGHLPVPLVNQNRPPLKQSLVHPRSNDRSGLEVHDPLDQRYRHPCPTVTTHVLPSSTNETTTSRLRHLIGSVSPRTWGSVGARRNSHGTSVHLKSCPPNWEFKGKNEKRTRREMRGSSETRHRCGCVRGSDRQKWDNQGVDRSVPNSVPISMFSGEKESGEGIGGGETKLFQVN